MSLLGSGSSNSKSLSPPIISTKHPVVDSIVVIDLLKSWGGKLLSNKF